jgi:hypothetical protein
MPECKSAASMRRDAALFDRSLPLLQGGLRGFPSLTAPMRDRESNQGACRIFSRSQSTLFVASPEVRRDLYMASRAIRSLLHEIDRVASRCEDEAHILRALQVDVGER